MKDSALTIMLEHIKQRYEPYAAESVKLLEKALDEGDRKQYERDIRAAISVYRNPPPLVPLQ